MRVLQANKFFYSRGGAERYFLDLLDLLPSHNIDVAPFSMRDPRNRPTPYERFFVPTVDYRTSRRLLDSLTTAARTIYHKQARTSAGALVEAFKPDLVHLHNIHHQITGSILDAFGESSIPVVQTLHDYQWVCPVYTFLSGGRICESCRGGRFFQAVMRRCQDHSLSRSAVAALELWLGYRKRWIDQIHTFLAPSQFMEDKMVEHGIPAKKIERINYCLNLEAYNTEGRERGGHVLYAGRLSPEKGVRTLLEALQLLPRAHLRIAGAGPMEEELRNLAALGAEDRVQFLGHLEPEPLRKEVSSAALVVVPSEWYENQPFAVLESFALSTPVLGADIGGIPELVRPGRTGWLFTPGDARSLGEALNAALACKEKEDLGACARRFVEEEFDPGRHIDRLASIYRKAAA